MLREALRAMGRADLIGPGSRHLVPGQQPRAPQDTAQPGSRDRKPAWRKFTTKGTPAPGPRPKARDL